jgi:DNA-binding HxlR family transcriptional regulator
MAEQKKMAPHPVEVTLSIIGGKWKPLIVFYLLSGTKRFSEIRRFLPQATQQMLTLQLRELEQAGVLHRHVYAQVPPKVEYSLTELGQSIEPVLRQMCSWGEWYSEQMGLEFQRLEPSGEAHLEKQHGPRTLITPAE